MSLVEDLKKHALDTIDALDKKKNEALRKASELKEEYDRNQRQKKGDSLYQKEKELKELEISLKQKEDEILKKSGLLHNKEKELNRRKYTPKIAFFSGIILCGLIYYFPEIKNTIINAQSSFDSQEKKQPMAERETDVYSTFNDIDANDPNFDIGNYCLDKEKRGNITFEECLGVAASKLIK